MQFEKYEIKASPSFLRFEFYSTGPKGKIKKQVEFEAFEETLNVFNIGFGDVDDKGNINDLIITGNEDSQKVLATVALSVLSFLKNIPIAMCMQPAAAKAGQGSIEWALLK